MAYTTTAAVKAHLGITGTGQDSVIDGLVAAAGRIIDNYTGSFFEAVTGDRTYDYQTDVTLWLDAPLHSLTTVTNGDGEAFASGELRTMPLNGPPFVWLEVMGSSGTVFEPGDSGGQSAITVTGTWGHLDASGNTPTDITTAATMIAAWLYNRRQYHGVSTFGTAETRVRFNEDNLPLEIREILDGYRFPQFRDFSG